LNPDQGALECDEGAVIVNIIATSTETLFRPFLRAHCAFEIDFVRSLSRLRKNANLIGEDFSKTPGDCERCPRITLSVAQLSDFQFRKERRMTGQNAQITLRPRDLQLIDLLVDKLALGSDDRQLNHAFILSACSSASSMVPTM
jgi:hypothetical protein